MLLNSQGLKRLILSGLVGGSIALGVAAILDSILASKEPEPKSELEPARPEYKPRQPIDTSGYAIVIQNVEPWPADASLDEISTLWRETAQKGIRFIDQILADPAIVDDKRFEQLSLRAMLAHFEGEPKQAAKLLGQARLLVQSTPELSEKYLFSVIYYQGVTALREGETDNCVLCRGESSCILPISSQAVHTNPRGSREAITHFTVYLSEFPDDLEVRWLLNFAHMTLGEHPHEVDPKHLLTLDHYRGQDFGMGKFRDVGHLAGAGRLNQAGGAIMEDFDNDGLLDIVVTTLDPTQAMAFYRNKGDGKFEDRTEAAGLSKQLGGLNCAQADYNNDGFMDIFIARGAWVKYPMRPSLLRNNGDGTFIDVTKEAGLSDAVNSNCAIWGDYDNDGFVDLFICCERQPNRLYRNKGNGTFEEVSRKAGLPAEVRFCKGAAWIDFDNDGFLDLFLNNMRGPAQLFRNNRDGTFTDVTAKMGISGPSEGFSCWAFDYDNDGWVDIFATSYDRTVEDVVKGLIGQPHSRENNKLYRNMGGERFQDVTKEAGLDKVFACMGSNFADFDGDGFLDFYLGTGDPKLSMLVPNRMFKNLGGKSFGEVTAASGTGHLQKGHGVACGDWKRDGNIDIFIETGGATNGDKYHNVLFLNPGHGNNWLTVKLIGKKTNRAAIGARIKVVTSGENPLTIHRHVSSGSSFGANPLQQTIGIAKSSQVALLEIEWPTSGTKQVFRNIDVNQAIEVTEFAEDYRKLDWKPVPVPK